MYNPLVTGAPHIRFYAGAPLVTSNGMRLGSLCVIDTEPRHLDAEQLMVLANFAEVVVREIEKDMARVRPSPPICMQHDVCEGNRDLFVVREKHGRTAHGVCCHERCECSLKVGFRAFQNAYCMCYIGVPTASAMTSISSHALLPAQAMLGMPSAEHCSRMSCMRAERGDGPAAQPDVRPHRRDGLFLGGHHAGEHQVREVGHPVRQRRLVAGHRCAPEQAALPICW